MGVRSFVRAREHQVVAGMKYEIWIENQKNGVNSTNSFIVWDHFGELSLLDTDLWPHDKN
jgi:hypothetical protein